MAKIIYVLFPDKIFLFLLFLKELFFVEQKYYPMFGASTWLKFLRDTLPI